MEIRDNVFIVTGGASGLGEGSGAVLAVPMVRSAVAALTGIAQLSDLT